MKYVDKQILNKNETHWLIKKNEDVLEKKTFFSIISILLSFTIIFKGNLLHVLVNNKRKQIYQR